MLYIPIILKTGLGGFVGFAAPAPPPAVVALGPGASFEAMAREVGWMVGGGTLAKNFWRSERWLLGAVRRSLSIHD